MVYDRLRFTFLIMNITNEDNMDLMARYDDNHFDLAIVDPPYGIEINSSGRLGHYGGKNKKWRGLVVPPCGLLDSKID